jgi:alpha,alpha-trehalose phosphorylase
MSEDRFPIEPWRLTEVEFSADDLGLTETLFAVGNGYIGMRANPEEGRRAHKHGTFLNGFHETWPIQHAEAAFGFAKTGQTRVNVPDAKLMKLFVDDEPLSLATADLAHYERVLDFRAGTLTRDLLWRTPAGKQVRVRTSRLISLVHRHVAVLTLEVTMVDASAPIVVSSQMLNREDLEGEQVEGAVVEGVDPRRSREFAHRVLEPRLATEVGDEVMLGYRCRNSGMTLACAYRHLIESDAEHQVETIVRSDLAKTVISARAQPGQTLRIAKFVSYHSAHEIPPPELANRCTRSLARAVDDGEERIMSDQRAWLDDYWARTDVELRGDDRAQQAIRWNLFHLAQATALTQEQGVGAKGVTGFGYEGHYFWDTEIYVIPFLAYTNPEIARSLLRFRWHMLPMARQRAAELNQRGALYPWRTINGEEASAYYAAGTAQYHINAAITMALKRYIDASGDFGCLLKEGAEMLVETARLWEDLGFYGSNGDRHFHIHGVTGPDEYTTVVNDNLYTNVMARFNLAYAADVLNLLKEVDPRSYARLARRVKLAEDEPQRWLDAAAAMYLPYDEELGIHPQDESFLDREVWDFAATPEDDYPLLLHYHPLVIYRFQVLKQADVVLAMVLQGHHFDLEQKRRNFDYYDAITTGDSSLSACVQGMSAAQIGYGDLALDYFREALYVDLADTHGNADDGVHIASAAGVWHTLVFGFAGLDDTGRELRFKPSLPKAWESITFHLHRHGSRLRVDIDADGCTVSVLSGPEVPIERDGERMMVAVGDSVHIEPAAWD